MRMGRCGRGEGRRRTWRSVERWKRLGGRAGSALRGHVSGLTLIETCSVQSAESTTPTSASAHALLRSAAPSANFARPPTSKSHPSSTAIGVHLDRTYLCFATTRPCGINPAVQSRPRSAEVWHATGRVRPGPRWRCILNSAESTRGCGGVAGVELRQCRAVDVRWPIDVDVRCGLFADADAERATDGQSNRLLLFTAHRRRRQGVGITERGRAGVIRSDVHNGALRKPRAAVHSGGGHPGAMSER